MTQWLPDPVEPIGIDRVSVALTVTLSDGRTLVYDFPHLVPDAEALRVTDDPHTHVSVDVQRSLPPGGDNFAPRWRPIPQRAFRDTDADLVTIALRGLRAVPVDQHGKVSLTEPAYTIEVKP